MTNGGIIEGHTEYSGCSDLSLAIGYAGRWTNIPDGDYLFGGSGATLRAASLRKPAIEKEARLRTQHYSFGSGETRMQMRIQQWFGGIVAGTPPRSQSLL